MADLAKLEAAYDDARSAMHAKHNAKTLAAFKAAGAKLAEARQAERQKTQPAPDAAHPETVAAKAAPQKG